MRRLRLRRHHLRRLRLGGHHLRRLLLRGHHRLWRRPHHWLGLLLWLWRHHGSLLRLPCILLLLWGHGRLRRHGRHALLWLPGILLLLLLWWVRLLLCWVWLLLRWIRLRLR